MTDPKKQKHTAMIDGVYHALAEADADAATGKPEAEEDRRELARIRANARELVRRFRQQAFEEARAQGPAMERVPVPARILAMTRDALIARIRALLAAHGGELQLAHRNPTGISDSDLDGMSDADLQTLLADLEPEPPAPNG